MKKLLLLLAALFVLTAVQTQAADLQWDYPADWNSITGYIIYFNEQGDVDAPYIKSLVAADVVQDGVSVTYAAIDEALNLMHNQPYDFYLTAYNADGESGPSNVVAYTRQGFIPPLDHLPPPVVGLPQSLGDLRIN